MVYPPQGWKEIAAYDTGNNSAGDGTGVSSGVTPDASAIYMTSGSYYTITSITLNLSSTGTVVAYANCWCCDYSGISDTELQLLIGGVVVASTMINPNTYAWRIISGNKNNVGAGNRTIELRFYRPVGIDTVVRYIRYHLYAAAVK